MGADLYLESVFNAHEQKHKPIFDAAVVRRDGFTEGSPERAAAQEAVSAAFAEMYSRGYFRDCYNNFGLFANMGISWWDDVIPMLDEQGYLAVEKARELLARVQATPITLGAPPTSVETTATARMIEKALPAGVTAEPPLRQRPGEERRARYEEWRDELVAILTESIALEEPLRCSL